MFRILHDIVPTKVRLHRFRIIGDPRCSHCKTQKMQVETLEHLFVSCSRNSEAFASLNNILISPIQFSDIVTGHFIINRSLHEVNSIVEYLSIIWYSRNDEEFGRAVGNSITLRKKFESSIKLRVKADYIRLTTAQFEKIWSTKIFKISKYKDEILVTILPSTS